MSVMKHQDLKDFAPTPIGSVAMSNALRNVVPNPRPKTESDKAAEEFLRFIASLRKGNFTCQTDDDAD